MELMAKTVYNFHPFNYCCKKLHLRLLTEFWMRFCNAKLVTMFFAIQKNPKMELRNMQEMCCIEKFEIQVIWYHPCKSNFILISVEYWIMHTFVSLCFKLLFFLKRICNIFNWLVNIAIENAYRNFHFE